MTWLHIGAGTYMVLIFGSAILIGRAPVDVEKIKREQTSHVLKNLDKFIGRSHG